MNTTTFIVCDEKTTANEVKLLKKTCSKPRFVLVADSVPEYLIEFKDDFLTFPKTSVPDSYHARAKALLLACEHYYSVVVDSHHIPVLPIVKTVGNMTMEPNLAPVFHRDIVQAKGRDIKEQLNYDSLLLEDMVGCLHDKGHQLFNDNTEKISIINEEMLERNIMTKAELKNLLARGHFTLIKNASSYRHLISELTYLNFCIDSVYIIHYTKLTERKEILSKMLEKEGLTKQYNIVWMDSFDREVLSQDQIKKNFQYNANILQRSISLGEIANGIAHNHVLEHAKGLSLIIEDDMLLCQNFLDNLHVMLESAPASFEAISLGGYRDDNPDGVINDTEYIINPEKITLVRPQKVCVQTGSFLIKESLCERVIKHRLFRPFSAPIDETLCHVLPDVNADVFWVRPLLAYEGSKVLYGTSFKERGF